jgi:cellulose synthase/poly-beta-1,6-N-acetylglucosamine synthase-like glycosyltransferase
MKISYAICVCNESRELFSLLSFLLKVIDEIDNIHVVVDTLHVTDKVRKVLHHFKNVKRITVFERPFDKFYLNSNYHLEIATGEYVFGLDADEMPTEELIRNTKKIIQQSNTDLIFVPRMNVHPGITQEFINQSNGFFKLNEVEFVNWPDYQGKIIKKCEYIRYSNITHCVAEGSQNKVVLQPNPKLGMWHIKSIEKQESRWSHSDRYANVKPPDPSNLYDELM